MILETYKTGTTTVGIVAKDGIVLASDMQATMGHLKSNLDMVKIYKINNNLAVTISGSVGDALALIRYLRVQANMYDMEHKTPLNTKACATLLSNILNSNKMMPFYAQFILAGNIGGFKLYSLDVAGGLIEENNFAASGSGYELALSSLDKNYKKNMSVKEAITIAKEAISSSHKRDIYTGGKGIKIVVIKKDNIEELPIAKYI